ncbi:hypothetical protein ACH0BF_16335 [Pseudobacillus sp. 179-B 2D1 NHS]|uniref:hypothetical protein n=1 Tax=Pseudobacillus sp. 179-B 2D1 NHS TaxID=3374292 RepID=UPI0038791231
MNQFVIVIMVLIGISLLWGVIKTYLWFFKEDPSLKKRNREGIDTYSFENRRRSGHSIPQQEKRQKEFYKQKRESDSQQVDPLYSVTPLWTDNHDNRSGSCSDMLSHKSSSHTHYQDSGSYDSSSHSSSSDSGGGGCD